MGLSPSTVARALSGRRLLQQRKQEEGAGGGKGAELQPNSRCKDLKSKRTNKILFCIPDIYNPFYFGMIKGANDVLEEYGYYTLLCIPSTT